MTRREVITKSDGLRHRDGSACPPLIRWKLDDCETRTDRQIPQQLYHAPKNKPSKEHSFKQGYIDTFAGTGYRDARQGDAREKSSQTLLLPNLAEWEP